MSKFLLLAVAIAVLSMPITARSDVKSEVTAILDYSARVWNGEDVDSIANFYHKEFVLVTDTGVVNLEQHLEELREIGVNGGDRGELEYSDIEVKQLDEDHAVAYGRLTLKFKDGSVISKWFTTVYVDTPFGWKAILRRG